MKPAILVAVLALLVSIGCRRQEPPGNRTGDAARGPALVQTYGCGACHDIPGIPMARGLVGPPLGGIANRELIAGILSNTPDNMVSWLMDPPAIDERTLMPDMGIPEEDARHIAAFLGELSRLRVVGARGGPAPIASVEGGDPDRGKRAISQYGCGSCHVIPGVAGAEHLVGPPLVMIGRRQYLAGALPNSPDNMIQWIMRPQDFEPLSAMPNLGVTKSDARDITAFLYTLR